MLSFNELHELFFTNKTSFVDEIQKLPKDKQILFFERLGKHFHDRIGDILNHFVGTIKNTNLK